MTCQRKCAAERVRENLKTLSAFPDLTVLSKLRLIIATLKELQIELDLKDLEGKEVHVACYNHVVEGRKEQQ